MGNYSIKELEKLSGVKSHTIRIWEQRYGLLKPGRTETNIRYYDDQQLKRLLNISILNNNGHKISKISSFTNEQIQEALRKILSDNVQTNFEEKIKGLIVAMMELDEQTFNQLFNDILVQVGFDETIQQVIYPFLIKVGIMWGIDEVTPPYEHFITNLIRNKVIAEVEKLPFPEHPENTFVLFLPEDELHEIGLLLAQYALRKKGHRVIYLGQNTPVDGIQEIVNKSQADYLMTFFIKAIPPSYIQEYINRLSILFKDQQLLAAGREDILSEISFPATVRWLRTPDDLKQFLFNK